MNRIAAALLCLAVLACGPPKPLFSSLSRQEREPIQTYTFARPYAEVYQATFDALSNAGFEISVYDRSAGQISTAFMQVSDTPLSIGRAEDVLFRPIRAKVSAKITEVDPTSTQVSLGILLQFRPRGWEELPRDVDQMRAVYAKYFGLIQEELLW